MNCAAWPASEDVSDAVGHRGRERRAHLRRFHYRSTLVRSNLLGIATRFPFVTLPTGPLLNRHVASRKTLATFTEARKINDRGQIVGFFSDHAGHSHGFSYQGGRFATVDVPGAAGTFALGLNSEA
jgi:probable HAF family extracellular repeat protein